MEHDTAAKNENTVKKIIKNSRWKMFWRGKQSVKLQNSDVEAAEGAPHLEDVPSCLKRSPVSHNICIRVYVCRSLWSYSHLLSFAKTIIVLI